MISSLFFLAFSLVATSFRCGFQGFVENQSRDTQLKYKILATAKVVGQSGHPVLASQVQPLPKTVQ